MLAACSGNSPRELAPNWKTVEVPDPGTATQVPRIQTTSANGYVFALNCGAIYRLAPVTMLVLAPDLIWTASAAESGERQVGYRLDTGGSGQLHAALRQNMVMFYIDGVGGQADFLPTLGGARRFAISFSGIDGRRRRAEFDVTGIADAMREERRRCQGTMVERLSH